MPKFVLLQGIKHGNKFFTTNDNNESKEDKVKMNDGTKAYNIIGYADSVQEAQIALYGKSFD